MATDSRIATKLENRLQEGGITSFLAVEMAQRRQQEPQEREQGDKEETTSGLSTAVPGLTPVGGTTAAGVKNERQPICGRVQNRGADK